MRNKKLINRGNDITQGWQFCSPGRGKKKKKRHYNTRYWYLVTHPSTNPAEQGLTLLSRQNMLLSLWYSDNNERIFFKFHR